jgi:hypothetical protein
MRLPACAASLCDSYLSLSYLGKYHTYST